MNRQLVNPKRYLDEKGLNHKIPKRIVIAYAYSVGLAMATELKLQRNTHWNRGELYTDNKNTIGLLLNIGLGGPALAMFLHEGKNLGVKEVILLGIAGSMKKQTPQGSLLRITSAYAEDGVSIHYGITQGLKICPKNSINISKLNELDATCVSTSAPYMEDVKFFNRFSKIADCVDMESSVLFAVCNHLKLKSASYLVINDTLLRNKWVFPSDTLKTKIVLRDTLKILLKSR